MKKVTVTYTIDDDVHSVDEQRLRSEVEADVETRTECGLMFEQIDIEDVSSYPVS